MTRLSVVVAAAADMGDPTRCAAALCEELEPGDEIVWVGASPPEGAVTLALPSASGGRGGMYRAGLDIATHTLIAFTDAATLVQPGWRRAVDTTLVAGATAVGGPVLPECRQAIRSFAGFVVEYGPHAAPPFSSASGDVAANNVAYERSALLGALGPGEPMWKSQVDARLAEIGRPPVVHGQMRVVSTKRYRWSDLTSGRAAHGRLHGAQRALDMSLPRRAFGMVRLALLPLVAYGRLGARLASRPGLFPRFVLATPLVLLALTAWTVGEAVGLLTANGDPDGVL